jgi:hypothetical protein
MLFMAETMAEAGDGSNDAAGGNETAGAGGVRRPSGPRVDRPEGSETGGNGFGAVAKGNIAPEYGDFMGSVQLLR